MKLLFICAPDPYPQFVAETPELYEAISNDDRFELYHADPKWIMQREFNDRLPAIAVGAGLDYQNFKRLSERAPQQYSISDFNLAFCRTLKPFPDGYMTRLADFERQGLKFVNSPQGILLHLSPSFLPSIAKQYTPELVVTRSVDCAIAFLKKHNTIVAKKANSCGGKGVRKLICRGDDVFEVGHQTLDRSVDTSVNAAQKSINAAQKLVGQVAYFSELFASDPNPFQLVRFLENGSRGDKRVIVVNEEIYGAYLRRNSESWVHNVSAGAEVLPATVTPKEREIIKATAARYSDLGIHTLGYDFLTDDDDTWTLSEINAGNIAGYSILEKEYDTPALKQLADWMLRFSFELGAV